MVVCFYSNWDVVEANSSPGEATTVTAKKEVVLSAGAFGTPTILLNSGIGDKKDLDEVKVKTIHELPDVGKGLSDHLTFPLSWSANGVATPVNTTAALEQWQTNRTGPLTEAVGHQIMFARIPGDTPLLKDHPDPASGPNAPHFEITLAVRSVQWRQYQDCTDDFGSEPRPPSWRICRPPYS